MRRLFIAAAVALLLTMQPARAGDPAPAKPMMWSIDVVVADEDGHPVANARVEAFAVVAEETFDGPRDAVPLVLLDPARAPLKPRTTAITGAKGDAHVAGLAFGGSVLVVSHAGFATRRCEVTSPGTDGPIRFELLRGHALEGRVILEDGRPVAGALVVATYHGESRLGPMDDRISSFDPWMWTDSAGRWHFDSLPEGEVAITAAPAGTWSGRFDRIALPNVARYDYVLDPCAPVAGTVRDKATGAPLAGALVDLEGYSGGHETHTRVVADDHGRWSVPLFVTETVDVVVKGYESVTVKRISGDDVVDARLERRPAEEADPPPPPAGAWIRGIVFGPDGGPLHVEIRRQGEADWAASSEDGTFVLPCESPAAPVRVWAVKEKGDFVTAEATPAATADEAVPVVLRWPRAKEPTFHVAGIVRPPAGVKLLHPRVNVSQFEDLVRERWLPASPDGRFDVEIPESARGYFQVAATADGCGIAVTEKPESGVELRLPVGASIRGRVLVAGAPLAGASVRMAQPSDGVIYHSRGEDQSAPVVATSADDGAFAASGLPAGRFNVFVEARGLVGSRSSVEFADGSTAVVDAELVAPVELRGVAKWPDGSPVVGADVSSERVGRADWDFGDYSQDTTDREGRFALRGLRPGGYDVDVSPNYDDRSFLETTIPGIAAGGPPTTVIVRVGGTLRGHVVDQRGAPVAGAGLRIDPHEENPSGYRDRTATSAADGSFEMRALDDGEYLLAARAPGLRTVRDVVVRGGAVDLRVVIPDGVSLAGVLVDAAGAPLAGHVVHTRRGDSDGLPRIEVQALTDAAGRFVLAGLDEGRTYVDLVGDDGWRTTSPRWFVAPTRDARLVVLEELALSGSVWEGDDEHTWSRRLPGARVRIDVAGRAEPIWTVTDDDGRYQVGGLPTDAKLTIHAEVEGYEEVFVPTVEGTRDGGTVVLRRKSAK